MKHKKTLGAAILVLAISAIGTLALTKDTTKNTAATPKQQVAQSIPEGTNFKEVKKLSEGKKPACLAHDPSLDQVVQDDEKLPFDKSFSMALGTVITDMPAGFTDVYLNEYTPTRASGYEVFSDKNQESFVGDLKSFNFTIERDSPDSQWKLDSFIACSE